MSLAYSSSDFAQRGPLPFLKLGVIDVEAFSFATRGLVVVILLPT